MMTIFDSKTIDDCEFIRSYLFFLGIIASTVIFFIHDGGKRWHRAWFTGNTVCLVCMESYLRFRMMIKVYVKFRLAMGFHWRVTSEVEIEDLGF